MMRRRGALTSGYLALAVAGTVLPLSQFLPWFAAHGPDVRAFVEELFSTRIGGFFGWDVIVSAAVASLFIAVQGARDRVRWRWAAIAAIFTVGVSCGLPLFLAMRERALHGRRDG